MDKKTTIQQLKDETEKFVSERNWQEFQTLRSLAISLSLEANELLDHFQWLNDKEAEEAEKDSSKKSEYAEELCDMLSYILIASNRLKIDISDEFMKKMERNRKKYPALDFKELDREDDNKRYQEKRKDWDKKSK